MPVAWKRRCSKTEPVCTTLLVTRNSEISLFTMSLLRFSRIASRPIIFRTPSRLISSSGVRNADPFPLPLQSHQPSTQNDSEVAKNDDSVPPEFMPKPLARHGEDIETLRARLVYQSRKRGNLEMDLIFSTFAKENMATMSEEELKEFDKVS